ncbi:MAG: type III-B CRISPR module RAMP protein Cmr1 [Candidatus Electrothrix sp. ATG2]|nr:type III-B CRISPR module RAMP protein Cmr1 [Candidatus Electrothrix sp. ATG2]
MRLRDPKDKIDPLFNLEQTLQDLDQQAAQREKEKWHKYEIEVITPIFGGGVEAGEPDTKMPIRASAIRGQLRYWWRFLTKAENPTWTEKKLFEEERDIWGGMAEEGEDHASKVRIRIENVPNVFPKEYPEKCPGQYQDSRRYPGLAYALFPARKTQDDPKAKELIWVDSNNKLTFDLLLCVPEENFLKIEQVLRWWVTFGGIGARTRRGCGSIHSLDPKLNPITETEANTAGCILKFRDSINGDALFAWEKAVDRLHKFRQGENVGRNGRFGRSKWPEPDSIREIADTYLREYRNGRLITHEPEHEAKRAFPRAAFGLPIIFKFKNDHRGEPPQSELTPVNGERLSSPLILTPYPEHQDNNVQYRSAALLMKTEHLKTLSLMLGDQQIDDWWDESKATFNPIANNNGTDALTAFMNFFAQGGA